MPLSEFEKQQMIAEINVTLEFYADQGNYETSAAALGKHPIMLDRGRAAQRAKANFKRLINEN